MKIVIVTVITLLLLALSLVSLFSTCMWGCPNTGIQFIFKISTAFLAIASIYCFYQVWVQFKKNACKNKGFQK